MIVETCEPGIITYLLPPSKLPLSSEPDTPIGILTDDEEEHTIIRSLIDQVRPDPEDLDPLGTILEILKNEKDIEREGDAQWEAYLHTSKEDADT
ncbi:hypothetical protein TrRE_jg5140 [Triparma retinervis]|uniref:Uncharacterized protein n=1 Tax=Triparma retinervis TaxID=2557542 RepID=A0A9W7E618_9STRA|nr:hypothetical protein TrRE_jg5140 [Triparma retinervis]